MYDQMNEALKVRVEQHAELDRREATEDIFVPE